MSTPQLAPENAPSTLRTILADRAVGSVIILSFVVMMGLGLVFPILPLFALSFGVSYSGAAALMSSYGVMRLVLDVFAGGFIDNFGERRAGMLGLLLMSGGTLVTALAPNYIVAVASWAVAGGGSAILMAANYSYILKVAPRDAVGRTLGVFYGSFNAGLLAGGLGSGFIAEHFGLASPLLLHSVILVGGALLYRRLLVDPGNSVMDDDDDVEESGPLSRIRRWLGQPGFVAVLFLNFSYIWFVTAAFDTFVPLFAEGQLNMTPAGIGIAYAATIVTEFAVLYPAGLLTDRIGRRTILLTSYSALALLIASLGSVASPAGLVFVMALLGIASGFAAVGPAALLSDITTGKPAGTAVATFRFAGDLAFVLGPITVGAALDNFHFATAAAIAAVPVLIALVVAIPLKETLAPRPHATARA